MTLQPLTARQREVLDFIQATVYNRGVAPTLDEMRAQFSVRSFATVSKHVSELQRKGYVRRRWNRTRGIELVTGRHCPTCTCPAEHGEAKPA